MPSDRDRALFDTKGLEQDLGRLLRGDNVEQHRAVLDLPQARPALAGGMQQPSSLKTVDLLPSRLLARTRACRLLHGTMSPRRGCSARLAFHDGLSVAQCKVPSTAVPRWQAC